MSWFTLLPFTVTAALTTNDLVRDGFLCTNGQCVKHTDEVGSCFVQIKDGTVKKVGSCILPSVATVAPIGMPGGMLTLFRASDWGKNNIFLIGNAIDGAIAYKFIPQGPILQINPYNNGISVFKNNKQTFTFPPQGDGLIATEYRCNEPLECHHHGAHLTLDHWKTATHAEMDLYGQVYVYSGIGIIFRMSIHGLLKTQINSDVVIKNCSRMRKKLAGDQCSRGNESTEYHFSETTTTTVEQYTISNTVHSKVFQKIGGEVTVKAAFGSSTIKVEKEWTNESTQKNQESTSITKEVSTPRSPVNVPPHSCRCLLRDSLSCEYEVTFTELTQEWWNLKKNSAMHFTMSGVFERLPGDPYVSSDSEICENSSPITGQPISNLDPATMNHLVNLM
jgi:hypothetical protein